MTCVFDIEASDWSNIYAIGFYDGKKLDIEARIGKDNDYFIHWLLDRLPADSVVFAHNGGRYDFIFLLDIDDIEIKDIFVIHGSIIQLEIGYKGKNITFRDSFAILPSSLKKLSESYDTPHKKLTMDYDLGIKDKDFRHYFENDLYALYEVLESCGDLKESMTAASAAMRKFKDGFFKAKMQGNYKKYDNVFREAYRGGRVEVFKRYGQNLNFYDVNSLYPFVMRKYKFPLLEQDNFEFSDSLEKNHDGIYNCAIETPNDLNIPVLPLKYNGKLIFPLGCFSGSFTSCELLKAQAKGYDIKINYGYVFDREEAYFKDYVDYFYREKSSSIGAKREIAKLMLNSLYGKFGQRRVVESYTVEDAKDYKKGEMEYVFMHKKFLKKKLIEREFLPYVHSEVASLITSHARLELYDLFDKVGHDNVYYCDTDSIITSKKLPVSKSLGGLKLEADIEELIALAPKVYSFRTKDETHIKTKGLRGANLDFDAFKLALSGDISDFNASFSRLSTFKEKMIHKNAKFATKMTIEKGLKMVFDKRVLLDDRITTRPLKIITE